MPCETSITDTVSTTEKESNVGFEDTAKSQNSPWLYFDQKNDKQKKKQNNVSRTLDSNWIKNTINNLLKTYF